MNIDLDYDHNQNIRLDYDFLHKYINMNHQQNIINLNSERTDDDI
jgi:hypothetical protein